MEQNVYIISLIGISVVFFLLMTLYFIMKAFEKLPSGSSKIKSKTKNEKTVKKKSKPLVNKVQKSNQEASIIQDHNVIAIITVIMAKKGISRDRISIKKIGG